MTSRPASPTGQTSGSWKVEGSDGGESQAAKDRRLLRERAERLIRTAHATDDVANRTGLILEAAMLHRLATVLEAQAAAFEARDPRLDIEPRSFAEPPRDRRLLN